MILLEHGPDGAPAVFDAPREVVLARAPDEVAPALARLDAARAAGHWVAGWLAYEAGLAFEPRLAACLPAELPGPMLAIGIFDAPAPAGPVLARAEAEADPVVFTDPVPAIARADYDAAIARALAYIAAGDCYQVNLTFPLDQRLVAGTALGLYGALRRRGAVGHGALVDLGAGPVVISRSPELFFRVQDGQITARPMKGTAPRDPDASRDAALAAALAASDKDRAENLMIVDLLRNDIGRLCRVGTVRVPALYAVERYATVHQMTSTVTGRLAGDPGLAGLMAALFPCGSVTGAPKIRAMQIIAELEPRPRGVYCGAVGWMSPGGDADFSVAIRTMRLFPDGRIVTNVGGGVVADSTARGEWEEALWKARFAKGRGNPG
ncbi:MAG: aminodeoxychorismate synthase component I [Rhodobacterales bacterium]|nr:aminodeoxychorismate synthase component I [Rhodobacterales bacterium]